VSTVVSPTVENVYSIPAVAAKVNALLPELYVAEYCTVVLGVMVTFVLAVLQYCEYDKIVVNKITNVSSSFFIVPNIIIYYKY
jgi:hypothetical protein